MEVGNFIISLDFELHWGGAEKWDLSKKKSYFDTTRKSIPAVLALFTKYEIHATWATVGFLFANSREQLSEFIPSEIPTYNNDSLSYYSLISNAVGKNEQEDPYHFAPSLIKSILDAPHQELGTHTFSHYYCNEPGQTKTQFNADLQSAQRLAKLNFNVELKSLVFPRNQFNTEYIDIASRNGIKVVRSNPNVWFWRSSSRLVPLARAVDTLMPISNSLTFKIREESYVENVLLLPASRFLRPYRNNEKFIQKLKLSRIKIEMSAAARGGDNYHLWWHPHNFGYCVEENLCFLEEILQHYSYLNRNFGFDSKSMIELYS